MLRTIGEPGPRLQDQVKRPAMRHPDHDLLVVIYRMSSVVIPTRRQRLRTSMEVLVGFRRAFLCELAPRQVGNVAVITRRQSPPIVLSIVMGSGFEFSEGQAIQLTLDAGATYVSCRRSLSSTSSLINTGLIIPIHRGEVLKE